MNKSAKEFAPGLPSPKQFGDITKIPVNELLNWVVQEHLADRAGRHFDIRMGPQGEKGPLYSWASRKGLPAPGEKRLAVQQPLHTGQYADFEGEIEKGTYGAGAVKTSDKGRVLVTKVKPNQINFVVAHKKFPEYFTLVRRNEKNWLLVNTTPQDIIQHKKVHYARVDAKDVEKLFSKDYMVSEKIDGAAALMKLFSDKIEILSYRPSVKGVPIVHTLRVGGATDVKIPKHLVGSVLRGEIYGVRKGTEEAIPPQQLGGILNSSLAKALEKQKQEEVELRMAVFNIMQRGKTPVPETTAYPERLNMLRETMQHLPGNKFHLPRMESEPEKQKQLWEEISKGLNPRTREGIVAWPVAGGKPTKVKLLNEGDVYVREAFPGKGRLEGRAAGGFNYSLTPTGPVVGEVGTGFDEPTREDLWQNQQDWVGRIARIKSQGQFPSGAHRAPSFIALHEDYPAEPVSKVAYQVGLAMGLKKRAI